MSQASTTTPIFHEFTNHLYSFGGELWDVNGESITPTVNTSQNVQALENFARFYPYTLPSSISFTWDDCVQSMAHGQAANAITFEDDSGRYSTRSGLSSRATWHSLPTRRARAGRTPPT